MISFSFKSNSKFSRLCNRSFALEKRPALDLIIKSCQIYKLEYISRFTTQFPKCELESLATDQRKIQLEHCARKFSAVSCLYGMC